MITVHVNRSFGTKEQRKAEYRRSFLYLYLCSLHPKRGKPMFSLPMLKSERSGREKNHVFQTPNYLFFFMCFSTHLLYVHPHSFFFLYFCVLFFSVPNISLFLCFVVLFSYTSLRRFHFFIFLYFTIPAFERERSHFYPLFLYNFTNYQTYYRASLKWRKSKGKKKRNFNLIGNNTVECWCLWLVWMSKRET